MSAPIVVAVNDSAAGFAAADVAIDYAHRLGIPSPRRVSSSASTGVVHAAAAILLRRLA